MSSAGNNKMIKCLECGDLVYYGDDYTGHLDVCHNITQDLDVDKYLAEARRQMEQKLAVSLEELPDQTQPQDKIFDKFVTENEHTLFSDDFLWDKDKKKKVSDNSALGPLWKLPYCLVNTASDNKIHINCLYT